MPVTLETVRRQNRPHTRFKKILPLIRLAKRLAKQQKQKKDGPGKTHRESGPREAVLVVKPLPVVLPILVVVIVGRFLNVRQLGDLG